MGLVEVLAFTRSVIELAERYPRAAAALLLWWLAATIWKGLPAELRARLEKRAPRVVGAIRLALFIGADLFGFVRTLYYQVGRGVARGEDAAPAPAPLPRDDSAVGS